MKHYYFAYGANTNLDSMADRCPGATPMGAAILYDHRLVFRTHCDIEQYDNQYVSGVLWELGSEHLYSLDMFEGYPNYYDRTQLTVYTDDQAISAWVYYMNTQDYQFPPNQGYFDLVWEGYEQNSISTEQLVSALEESYQDDVREN